MLSGIVLNKYTFIAAATVVLLGSGYIYYKKQLRDAAEYARTTQVEKQIAAYNVDLTRSLNTSNALVIELQAKVKELQDAKNTIVLERDAALDSLRKRPTRAEALVSASASPTSAPQACTGSELPREDAEFLTGEAANAALIATERDFYYERYEQSRIRLETLARELDRRPGQVSNPISVP